jgi:hypothetical protein
MKTFSRTMVNGMTMWAYTCDTGMSRNSHMTNLLVHIIKIVDVKCLTDQNCIHEEIKSRLNSGNACYISVQSLLSFRLLSRNVKVKIYNTIILPMWHRSYEKFVKN